jgi:hypothetical protein
VTLTKVLITYLRAGGMVQVVEHLPSKRGPEFEPLTAAKKNKTKQCILVRFTCSIIPPDPQHLSFSFFCGTRVELRAYNLSHSTSPFFVIFSKWGL